ncbi:LytR C-terminal domain-containing protein [Flindersiella endophytica]
MAWDTEYRAPQVRKRRRIRGPITLLLLLGLLSGAAYFGWNAVVEGRQDEATQVCNTPSADGRQRIASNQVVVNVFNAGKVQGLAGQTADQLRKRGFRIGKVATEESEVRVDKVLVRGRALEAPEVQLVLAQLEGERPVADNRTDSSVDIVVGDGFKGLYAKGPSSMTVRSRVPVCVTSTPSPTAS